MAPKPHAYERKNASDFENLRRSILHEVLKLKLCYVDNLRNRFYRTFRQILRVGLSL